MAGKACCFLFFLKTFFLIIDAPVNVLCINKWKSSSPGPSHPFVVVLRVHGQYGDPRADVYQQHGEGVVQVAGFLHAAVGVRWVLEVVALRVSIETNPVDVQQATNEAVQLI